jgi:WhiB family redox-sensing transcriptional regulator
MASPIRLVLADERPWAAYGTCRGVDPDLFFPGPEGDVGEATKICSGCPVQTECADWALNMQLTYGIWGGLTERDRRRLLRRSA